MQSIKIIHTSDLHFSRDTQEKALQSLDTLGKTAEKEKPDLIVIAGDLFDRPVNDTSSSGFPALLDRIQKLMDIAPIVATSGTPTHDLPGCYEPFMKIEANHNFTLLEPSKEYFLLNDLRFVLEKDDLDKSEKETNDKFEKQLLIFGLSEPQKTWFMKDKQLGKAESDEEINQGMRELLLGIGAIRKQYPDIPCLLVAHIEIANTPTCTGHIIQGGIKIGKDDLALVGADYIALGHIHLAQQIGELPAYYPSSAFPVDRGETDQKGFFIVTIEKVNSSFIHAVDRVNYPHIPNKKIILEKPWDVPLSEVDGFDVWLQLRATKEQRSSFDTDAIFQGLIEAGAGDGSRVEVVIKPTETIRCEGITEATHLKDKVKVWAELSDEKYSASILAKADGLETAAEVKGIVSKGLHIRLQKLILRGAIGIHKGLSKDQVEIDLENYEPGLLAMVGVNGSGKTTLIENMHPYAQMLTRTGKLQDHFCLRDSFRDLYFIDERTGVTYRAFMQIDGKNESGSIEYFLYQKQDGNDWVPFTEEINGRKDPYEKEIQKLFGSLSLFVKSAFVSQKPLKNLPEINDATKGEKKALFCELGGLDYLQAYADIAKEETKKLNDELLGIRSKLEFYDDFKSNIDTATSKVKDLSKDNDSALLELEEIEDRKKRLVEKSEDLKQLVDKNKEIRSEITNIAVQLQKITRETAEIDIAKHEYEEALKYKGTSEDSLGEYEGLKSREAKLYEEQTKIHKERERVFGEYNHKKEAVADNEKELQAKKNEADKAFKEAEHERDMLMAETNQINNDLVENPLSEDCPTCGQKWPPAKRKEFEEKRVAKETKRDGLQTQIFEMDKDIVEKNKAVLKLDGEIKVLQWPKEPFLPTFDESGLDELIEQLKGYDIDAIREGLDKAKEAEVRIEELTKRLDLLTEQEADLLKRKEDLHEKIDTVCESEYEEACKQLESILEVYASKDKEIAGIQAEIKTLQEQLLDLQKKLKELDDLKKSAGDKEKDLAEWEYLQRACGPDGIQALELDAMGPGIAEVANSILESAYGSRFQIEFKTTRIGGKGSQKKQIEDFQIWIHDSQDGSEQLLETLSGGESVWIKRAIYDAFGIIRARKTGTKFLTVFQDEADGALDPGARGNFFKMIGRAHQESERYHTIVITHDLEAQEVIGQKIDMNELKKVPEKEAVVIPF